jgi:hypothetical protein
MKSEIVVVEQEEEEEVRGEESVVNDVYVAYVTNK